MVAQLVSLFFFIFFGPPDAAILQEEDRFRLDR